MGLRLTISQRWNVDNVVKAWESHYAAFRNTRICYAVHIQIRPFLAKEAKTTTKH